MLSGRRLGITFTAVLLMVCGSALPAAAAPVVDNKGAEPTPPTSGEASGEEISAGAGTTVDVVTDGSTTTGVPFSHRKQVEVPRRCWYGQGMTGYSYYEYWKLGGVARESGTLDAFAAQGLLHPGYEDHGTDTEGHWYDAECAAHVSGAEWLEYRQAHPPVYVLAGTPAPAVREDLDPAFLAEVAYEHMQLPAGTVRWNPSLDGTGATVVNLETFVWVEDSATSVQVTASVPGVWSRVEARMTRLTLSAPNAHDAMCTDMGTPYAAGMTRSDCAVVFTRSTAALPVKDGQRYPTATLTATATWEATWTSSLDATPQALEVQTTTTTAEVPVAEIQTVVTR
ncbi:hypothetical protein [Cellulomonas sp. KH9]|uniref:hypothetical protein n=1 Tax=Cellulomonas sp. KH9 TaxID=1855324 RepID=UPI0008F2DA39|nr:hypothetical protein [Cellulomonas sp. KH9]SFJ64295.1 hypothetical protein SAMN05216467_0312 [Cellulomonas sp. KH9]